MARAEDAALTVQVVYAAAPHQVERVVLTLPVGSTVADAVAASGMLERHGLLLGTGVTPAVWGRQAAESQLLREDDRVELLRPLQVEPKELRRQRQRQSRGVGRPARTLSSSPN
jgi:uncharacterized protein